MPERLDAAISLDVAEARRQVEVLRRQVENDLSGAVSTFSAALARATSGTYQVGVTADTSQIPAEVSGAVDAGDTNVVVVGDASELTGEVTGAVDAADSNVVVTGDAADVTGAVDAAVDNADTRVEVTADAAPVTGAITAAVEDANTAVTVTADASSLREASGAVDELSGSIGESATQAGVLGAALGNTKGLLLGLGAGIGTGAVIAFLKGSVDAASDLDESIAKTDQVFRRSAGVIHDWAETASTSVLLSEQAALEAASSFGNLFTAMGLGRGTAAQISTEVVQLGADLASFNNIPVEDALLKLRSGLVGEIEPLRQLGVSFNAVAVEAKAAELGFVDSTGAATEAGKVQARYALILEQTGNAQGDVARTFGGLANQTRFAQAEFENARIELGQRLVPLMLAATQAGIPLATALVDIAGALITGITPALEATVPLAQILGTVLGALGDVLNVIPGPILTGAAAFLALRAAAGPLLSVLTGLQAGAISIATSFSPLQGIGLRAADGIHGLTQGLAANRGALTGAAVAGTIAASSFGQIGQSAVGSLVGIGSLAATGAFLGTTVMPGLGTAVGAAAGAVAGLGQFMLNSGKSAEELADEVTKLAEELSGLTEVQAARVIVEQFEALSRISFVGPEEGFAAIREQLGRVAEESPAAAQRVIDGLRDMGAASGFTEQQIAALQRIVNDRAETYGKHQAAAKQAAAGNRDVAAAAEEAAGGTLTAEEAAKAAADAFEEWAAVLEGGVASATALAESIRSGINAQVPQAGAVFSQFRQDVESAFGTAVPGVQGFVDTLASSTTGVEQWVNTVRGLVDAGLTGLAELVLSQGPQIGGALAAEINAQTPEVQAAWNAQIAASTGSLGQFSADVDRLSASIAVSLAGGVQGMIDSLMSSVADTETWVRTIETLITSGLSNLAGLVLQQGPVIGGALAQQINASTPEVQAAWDGQIGTSTERLTALNAQVGNLTGLIPPTMAAGLAPLPGVAGTAIDQATGAVNAQGGNLAGAAGGVAGQAAGQFGTGVSIIPGLAGTAVGGAPGQMSEAAQAQYFAALNAGYSLGRAFGDGIAQGIDDKAGHIGNTVAAVIRAARERGEREAGIASPSRLFAAMGRELGEGLALGLSETSDLVAGATAGLIDAAQGAITTPRLPEISVAGPAVAPPPGLTLSSVIAQRSGDPTSTITIGQVNVTVELPPGGLDPQEAYETGQRAGDGFVDGLARRRVNAAARIEVSG